MTVINWPLMSRWENWAIVLFSLLIATIAINSVSSLVLNKHGDN